MTCKDCIYENNCISRISHFMDIDEATGEGITDIEKRCKDFKNKAEYAEVKHGYWIKRGNEKKCSVCNFVYYSNNDVWNGCPNCLAKMDRERRDT